MFADRADAALQLVAALAAYTGCRPLVLGIPRGGVPMARLVADALGGEVDAVLVRKIGAPGQPEFAVGAVDESGQVLRNPEAALLGIPDSHFEREAARESAVLKQRRMAYSRQRPPADPAGRTVIVVDDGLATGATMIAALRAIRVRAPERLVCAVPVAPPETAEAVRRECDQFVCLEVPREFRAVGQYYVHFGQTTDAEVIAALAAG